MKKQFVYYSEEWFEMNSVTFDPALPQSFYDKITLHTGHNPAGHIVWAYPYKQQTMGWPAALTPVGSVMLGAFDAAEGAIYSQGLPGDNS